jgi:hypothetical protein
MFALRFPSIRLLRGGSTINLLGDVPIVHSNVAPDTAYAFAMNKNPFLA